MIIGGLLNDKYGPRWVMFVGGLMFGIGMFTCGFAQSVGNLMVSYGIVLGLGLSLVYGCTISNTIKFFPRQAGHGGRHDHRLLRHQLGYLCPPSPLA